MKALRVSAGQRRIAPFDDPVGEARVLDRPLRQAQEMAIAAAGLELVEAPPDEPYLIFSERTWFSAELARRVARAGPGRLRVADPDYAATYEALQDLAGPGLYEIGVHPGGPPGVGFPQLPPVEVDLDLKPQTMPGVHPALQFASRPVLVGPALVHQVDHWTHILRINLLALAARAAQAKLDWDRSPIWKKILVALGFFVRVRPLSRWDVVRGLNEVGKGVSIHPTATVELCVLEDGVEVGPHAVVRASYLGKGAKVEEFSSTNLSVLGEGAKLSRFGMLNLSVVYPGAAVSRADGYQACLIGRDAFLGWGVSVLDLSFGKPVKVEQNGEWVDSGQHFLGAVIGHRARLAFRAFLNYGVSVPNDAFLLGDHTDLIKSWGDAPAGEAVRWVDRRLEVVKKRS